LTKLIRESSGGHKRSEYNWGDDADPDSPGKYDVATHGG
jgi:hypothetical protein